MKISICIPMYNESAVCCDTLHTLTKAMRSIEADGYTTELIMCDDGSSDNTEKLLLQECEKHSFHNVKIIKSEKNLGKGSAVRQAVLASTGDFVLYTDCDLAYGTDPIISAVHRLEDGADCVLGSRNAPGGSYGEYTAFRRLASRVYIKVISIAAGFKMSDSQCGFKAFKGESARRIFSLCSVNGFAFDLEAIKIAQKMGLRVEETPVCIVKHSETKIRFFRDTFRMLSDIRHIKKKIKKLEV